MLIKSKKRKEENAEEEARHRICMGKNNFFFFDMGVGNGKLCVSRCMFMFGCCPSVSGFQNTSSLLLSYGPPPPPSSIVAACNITVNYY
jgi:hypothetical protein